MNRARTILALAVLMGLGSGCETVGNKREAAHPAMIGDEGTPRRKSDLTYAGQDSDDSLAGSARSSASSSRPRGAWSSEAADIEKNLTNRSASPLW